MFTIVIDLNPITVVLFFILIWILIPLIFKVKQTNPVLYLLIVLPSVGLAWVFYFIHIVNYKIFTFVINRVKGD